MNEFNVISDYLDFQSKNVTKFTQILLEGLEIEIDNTEKIEKSVYDFYINSLGENINLEPLVRNSYDDRGEMLSDVVIYLSFKINKYINHNQTRKKSFNTVIREIKKESNDIVKKEFNTIIKTKKTKLKNAFDEALDKNIKFIKKFDSGKEFILNRYKVEDNVYISELELNIKKLEKFETVDLKDVLSKKRIKDMLFETLYTKILFYIFKTNKNIIVEVPEGYLTKIKNQTQINNSLVGNLKNKIIFILNYHEYIKNKSMLDDLKYNLCIKAGSENVEVRRLTNVEYLLIDYNNSSKTNKLISDAERVNIKIISSTKCENSNVLNIGELCEDYE
jgi:predicted DNA binding CopG/RHH family protein